MNRSHPFYFPIISALIVSVPAIACLSETYSKESFVSNLPHVSHLNTSLTALAPSKLKVGTNMSVNSKTVHLADRVLIPMRMAKNTSANTRMVKSMDKGLILSQMAKNTLANGRMVNRMERVPLSSPVAINTRANTRTI